MCGVSMEARGTGRRIGDVLRRWRRLWRELIVAASWLSKGSDELKTLHYSVPHAPIKFGRAKASGFAAFDREGYSRSTRDWDELQALAKKNIGFARNIVAHYLLVCGKTISEVAGYLSISSSRAGTIATKGRLAVYPNSQRSMLKLMKPSYASYRRLKSSAAAGTGLFNDTRFPEPETPQQRLAHRLSEAKKEKFDAEDVLALFHRGDDRYLVIGAVDEGRKAFAAMIERAAGAQCSCRSCHWSREFSASTARSVVGTD